MTVIEHQNSDCPQNATNVADGGDITGQQNHEVVGEVIDGTVVNDEEHAANDTVVNSAPENEEIMELPGPDVQSQRNRQPSQRLTYYNPGNPAYLRPIQS